MMLNEENDKTQLVSKTSQELAFSVDASQSDLTDSTILEVREEFVDSSDTPFPYQPPINRLEIGGILKDRFQILESLGEGGMGMVFKAQDLRKVEARSRNPYTAIKVLNPALAKNELLVAALQRECEKAQELSHPNIITVYDFDRDGDIVFMSMEYLAGQSLSQLIRSTASAGGIRLEKAWPIIKQMGQALAYAHSHNIVHSDFKPANVFITQGDQVKVLDFGIASRTEKDHDHDATVFNARAEGGHTPPYASFEMMNGASADPRDDIYAFGLVVYEILTGKHPYQRKPASEVFIEQQKSTNKFTAEPIKGLTRRQWQALKSAIELLQDKRPSNLEDWLKQFNPESSKKPVLPLMLGMAIMGGLAVAGFNLLGQQPISVESNASIQQSPARESEAKPLSSQKPTSAIVGADLQIELGMPVVLNGTGSSAADGGSISYQWRLLNQPFSSQTTIQNSNTATPTFLPDQAGQYLVELKVSDQQGGSATASQRIDVLASANLVASHFTDGDLTLTSSKTQYRIGEQLKLNLHISKAGYLRVVYIGASGEISELLPNPFQNSKVKADTDIVIPPKSGKFKLEITGPAGSDKILAILSEKQMPDLTKSVDKNANIAEEYRKDNLIKVIEYTVK